MQGYILCNKVWSWGIPLGKEIKIKMQGGKEKGENRTKNGEMP